MAVNRGKKFESIIKEAFEKVDGVSIDRIHDQTNGFKNSSNICDFIVYKYPHQYYIECKSVHGNTLPISNITKNQREGLYRKSQIKGVCAGVIIWWVDKDVTKFIPIDVINYFYCQDIKSVHHTIWGKDIINIVGKKKRIFFDYDMQKFFNEVIEHDRIFN